ncbi:MAG: helix-turn-helix domain-containing protein [bacterium]|nr:helix-turn-helix domain-containing protein [bacterium]
MTRTVPRYRPRSPNFFASRSSPSRPAVWFALWAAAAILTQCDSPGSTGPQHVEFKAPPAALEVGGRSSSSRWLGGYLSHARENSDENAWTIQTASAPERAGEYRPFAPGESIPRLEPLSKTPVWLRFRLRNSSPRAARILLELRNASLVEVDLFAPPAQTANQGADFDRHQSGNGRPFSLRRIPYRTSAFALTVPPGEGTYYLRIAGYSYKKIPLRVFLQESDFERMAAAYTIFHGIFYGALGVMAIFNALLYFTIRDRSYIFMTAFIAFWATTMFIGDGYGRQYFWPDTIWFGDFFGVLNPAATICLLLFLRSFLRTRRHTPWIDRYVLPALIASYALVALSYPFLSDYLRMLIGFAIVLPSGFFVALLAFGLGVYVWRRGNPAGKYHTLAGGVFMIIGELQYLEVFDFVASNPLTENGARIGFVVYITLLTVGTGQRIKQIKESLQKLNARLQLEELRGELPAETTDPAAHLKETADPRPATEWTITPRTEALLQKTIARIQTDFRSEISRESLAQELDWNPDNLGRFFKMYTGERVGDFINRLRVECAAELLRDTEDRVTEIAFAVGFDSLKTFNRNFARILHTTPSEFRKISRMAPEATA